MNESDIEDAARRFINDPVLGPATRFLHRFCAEVNRHSDGWPYWTPPSRAAAKLMDLIHAHRWGGMGAYPTPPEPTMADVKRCLTPIKAFMTRRGTAAGMTMPDLN